MTPGSILNKPLDLLRKVAGALDAWTRPSAAGVEKGLAYWQERILLMILLAGSLLGLVAYIPSVILSVREGLYAVAGVDTAMYLLVIVLFVFRRIPYGIRAGSVAFISWFLGMVLTLTLGPFGAGPVYIFGFPVLAAVLLGVRACIAALAVNLLSLAAVGVLISRNVLGWEQAVENSFGKWLVISINFMLWNVVTSISATAVLAGLQRTLESEKATRRSLEAHRTGLENANRRLGDEVREHDRARKALEASEQRYRALFQGAAEGILIADAAGDRIRFGNPAAAGMLRCHPGELEGMPLREIIGDGPLRDTLFRDAADTGTGAAFDVVARRGDGSGMHMNITATSVAMDDEANVALFLTDISELRQREEEKERLQERLAQSRKMEAIGTLAGGVAHDFNNILGIILGNAEMALASKGTAAEVREFVLEIRTASLRARELVRQILSFARRSKTSRKPLPMTPLVRESLKLLRSSLPARVEIVPRIRCENDLVLANGTQIQQVIINLCANAAHAMRERGGKLEVAMCNEDVEDGGPGRNLEPGRYLVLSVSDTGHGIAPDIMDRIFEPYFTTKNVNEGTGMGLAVVHGIVTEHQGGIEVESRPGVGTRMVVRLPCSREQSARNTGAGTLEDLPAGTERILLVDDEKALRSMASYLLAKLGYSVRCAENGIEALDLFSGEPESFDLVITDMNMPGMSGDELVERLHEVRRDIPVILSTGFSERLAGRTPESLGVRAVVLKPVVMSEMAREIRRALDG
ncbi:MAG: ATP-binding protein [Desulfatibacillaceae bacterium]